MHHGRPNRPDRKRWLRRSELPPLWGQRKITELETKTYDDMTATDKVKYLERLGRMLSYYEDFQETRVKSDEEYDLVSSFIEDLKKLIIEFAKI